MNTGTIAVFGSGETAKQGRKIQEALLLRYPRPVRVAILETPAGFQPNVDAVTDKITAFYEHNLQNAKPAVRIVRARKKGTEFDPNDKAIAGLLDDVDVVFAGPGSPTYTVRQLEHTRTMAEIESHLKAGKTLVLASAASIAMGAYALPVYEIYKVGADLSWVPGLDLFRLLGLRLVVVPHWNNMEGGAELDTSMGYMGKNRFTKLQEMLPPEVTILGVDEHSAVILNAKDNTASVDGTGGVTVIHRGTTIVFDRGSTFPLDVLRGAGLN